MKTIAIAAGGDSSEYEISVKSAEEVARLLPGRYIRLCYHNTGNQLVLGRPEGSLS